MYDVEYILARFDPLRSGECSDVTGEKRSNFDRRPLSEKTAARPPLTPLIEGTQSLVSS